MRGSADENRDAIASPAARGSEWLRLRMWAVLTLLAAALLIFVLPLHVPMKLTQTVSASYLAGFNNSVALFSAAGLSVLVLCLTFWFRRRRDLVSPLLSERDLDGWFVGAVVLGSAVVLGVCGSLVAASHLRYLGDAGYIIEQATVRRDTGRPLYTQLEFAYGPLLLFPEIWVSRLLHCSMTAAYFTVLMVESSFGLLMMAFVLGQIPMRAPLRRAALALFALGAITPHLGLNYTFFRFVSPYAVLLVAARERRMWRCAALLCAGEALEVLISPELAFALAVGVLVFGLLRAWQRGWPWLVVALSPVLMLAAVLLTFGRPFLHMTASFSRGALSLPVGPYPHILVLVVALVWLVPVALGRSLDLQDELSARLLAVYAMSLAFLPAALGRCDPLHVMFDGVGMLMLSMFAISTASRRLQLTWVGCVAVLVLWSQFANQRPFELRTATVLRQTVMVHVPPAVKTPLLHLLARKRLDLASVLAQAPQPDFHLNMTALQQRVGTAPVATPMEISPAVEEQLRATHHYAPGYYAFGVDEMNAAAEQRSIGEMNACPWALLPTETSEDNPHTLANLAMFQGIGLPYKQRNTMSFHPHEAFERNLAQNWTAVQRFGPYVLYRNESNAGPGAELGAGDAAETVRSAPGCS